MQHSKYWVHGPHQLGFEQTFGEFIGGSFFAFSVGGGWLAVYIGVDRIIMIWVFLIIWTFGAFMALIMCEYYEK